MLVAIHPKIRSLCTSACRLKGQRPERMQEPLLFASCCSPFSVQRVGRGLFPRPLTTVARNASFRDTGAYRIAWHAQGWILVLFRFVRGDVSPFVVYAL